MPNNNEILEPFDLEKKSFEWWIKFIKRIPPLQLLGIFSVLFSVISTVSIICYNIVQTFPNINIGGISRAGEESQKIEDLRNEIDRLSSTNSYLQKNLAELNDYRRESKECQLELEVKNGKIKKLEERIVRVQRRGV